MKNWPVVLSLGAVCLFGCDDRGTVRSPCGRQCAEMERCDLTQARCVLNGVPLVAFTTPQEDELITTATVLVTGRVTDDASEFLNPELSLDGTTWVSLPVEPIDGDFSQRYDVPALDGQSVTVTVRLKDSLGAEGTGTRRFYVDRVAPRCRIASPSATTTLSGMMGELELEVTDDSRRYGGAELSLDNGVTWQSAMVMDGTARFTFPLPQDVNGVRRAIALRATDAAGNRCELSGELLIDTRGPEVTPVAPVADQQLNASNAPTYAVRFSVADPAGVTSAEVLAPPSTNFAPATVANGTAEFMWTLPASDDGVTRDIQLRATDALGNVTTRTLSVGIDLIAPTCTLLTPTQNQVLSSSSGASFTVTWNVSDGSTRLGPAEVSTDDGATWAAVTPSMGAASYPWMLDPMANGVATRVRVRGADHAGNRCTERTADVTVDLVAPVITITEPVANGSFNAPTLRFAGTVTDATTLTLDFGDGVGARPVAINGTAFAINVPLSATEDFVAHAAQLRARDGAGNERLVTRTVNVDRIAPVLTVASPTEGQLLNATQLTANQVVLQVSALDGDPLTTTEAQTGPTTWVPLTGNSFNANTSALDDGFEYQQQFRTRDSAGNTSTTSRRYRVDRVAPTVVSTSPVNNARRTAAEFSALFSEPMRLTGTALPFTFTPAAPVDAATSLASGDRQVTVRGLLGDESYSVVIDATRLTDLAGNPPVVAAPVVFITGPRAPSPNTVFITGSARRTVEFFRSSQDDDGVIALAVRVIDTVTSQRSWLLGWVDPKTGLWTQQGTAPASNTGATIFNTAIPLSNGTRRAATAKLGLNGPTVMWVYGVPGVVSTPELSMTLAPSASEDPNSSEVATFVPQSGGFSYRRTPGITDNTQLGVPQLGVNAHSPDHFVVWGANLPSGPNNGADINFAPRHCTGTTCTWGNYVGIGAFLSNNFDGTQSAIGDFLTAIQVLQTASSTFITVEQWTPDGSGTMQPTLFGFTGVFCANEATGQYGNFQHGVIMGMTRVPGSPDLALIGGAFPTNFAGVPAANFRLFSTNCPRTFSEPVTTIVGLNPAALPGATSNTVLPVFQPIKTATLGVIYVRTPGDLVYLE